MVFPKAKVSRGFISQGPRGPSADDPLKKFKQATARGCGLTSTSTFFYKLNPRGIIRPTDAKFLPWEYFFSSSFFSQLTVILYITFFGPVGWEQYIWEPRQRASCVQEVWEYFFVFIKIQLQFLEMQ